MSTDNLRLKPLLGLCLKSNVAEVGIENAYWPILYVYIHGIPVENQTANYWNLVGSSMTARLSCVIAQQHSSAIFVTFRFLFGKKKFGAYFKKFLF